VAIRMDKNTGQVVVTLACSLSLGGCGGSGRGVHLPKGFHPDERHSSHDTHPVCVISWASVRSRTYLKCRWSCCAVSARSVPVQHAAPHLNTAFAGTARTFPAPAELRFFIVVASWRRRTEVVQLIIRSVTTASCLVPSVLRFSAPTLVTHMNFKLFCALESEFFLK